MEQYQLPKSPSLRARGRPQHGRVTFKQVNVDAIQKIGSMSDLARSLNVKVTTVQQWVDPANDYPLPYAVFKNATTGHERKQFHREPVIRWLINTKRFTPGPGYGDKRR